MSLTEARVLDEKHSLEDGLENLVAQMGTEQDKRASSRFVNKERLSSDRDQLENMYRTDWLSGKVVDIIPDDMTREWRSFSGDIEPDTVEMLVEEENRLGLSTKFNLAHKWGRLYGTGFIVMSIDDGGDAEDELIIDNIKPGGLRWINVVDRHQLATNQINTIIISDPMNRNYGMPEFYRFNHTSGRIHHSRVLRFEGTILPFRKFQENNYFNDSILDRLYDSILNLTTVTHSAATMVYEANVDIFRIKGFMDYLSTAAGEARLRKRFALVNQMKSINNALLMDMNEEFTQKTTSFAGLPELIDRYGQLLAAATDIPATRLLGSAATGFNATGEGDLKNYYDKIGSLQANMYKPKLDEFDIIMAKSLGLADDADLSYTFDSLFQMTPEQQANTENTKAQRDAIYLDHDVITEETVAKELKQENTYTNISDEHIEMLTESANDDEDDDDGVDTDTDTDETGNGATVEEGEEEKGTSGEGSTLTSRDVPPTT